jgi:hypothetical protein
MVRCPGLIKGYAKKMNIEKRVAHEADENGALN